MTISFAMACYEAGLLTKEDTDGLELRFGNEEVIIPVIEAIARRQPGLGELLADGSAAAAAKIGRGAEQFLLTVKRQEIPMHDPRVKTGLGLQFALAPQGADHWWAQHDPFFATETSPGTVELAPMGLSQPISPLDLGPDKVRMVVYTSYLVALYDNLGVCIFTAVARSMTPLD
ncbi:MAG: aldehyde ferredoxin oxidoreductase, partial [Thermoleophilia bacterium]|nr:aldehyde ferredoxin oxidoreductase [Thermoleophilia bacterium]